MDDLGKQNEDYFKTRQHVVLIEIHQLSKIKPILYVWVTSWSLAISETLLGIVFLITCYDDEMTPLRSLLIFGIRALRCNKCNNEAETGIGRILKITLKREKNY